MDFNDLDDYDGDEDILQIIEFGFPRQIYQRNNHFDTLSNAAFIKRFRLSKATTLEILRLIVNQLEFPNDVNRSVSPINQLLLSLRFYATGNHLLSVADFSGVHVSTACRITTRVSNALAALYRRYIKMPRNEEEIRVAQNDFFDIAQFPRVVGAVDGTHIRIQNPGGDDGEIFRNRKTYFSLNVQGVSNAKLDFLNVVARWPGSAHDSTIFNSTNLRAEFEEGLYNNSILLGDSAYASRNYLFTPLLNPQTPAQQRYNRAHIRTRNVVERCFGLWKRRFPVVAYGMRLKLPKTMAVIIATAVLHNIAIRMGDPDPQPVEDEHQLDVLIAAGDIPDINGNINNLGANIRNAFIDNYFDRL